MKKTYSVNRLINSVSTSNINKIRNITNSSNVGKQQIILQSCCFFDYQRSQTPNTPHTPHPSHKKINYFDMKYRKRLDSEIISYSKNYRNVYLQTKMNLDKIKSKIDEIQKNNSEKNSSGKEKLKKENKALKETINNLILQLDKVFYLAETSKNNEMDLMESNNNNKQEMKLLKSKIDTLTTEKEELLKQIKGQDKSLNNSKTESIQTKKIGINKRIQNSQNLGKRYITHNLSNKNNKNFFTENKELDNKKYLDIINKLNQENVELKNKLNEQGENENEKEENYKNLLEENNNLKQDINELKIINRKYEEENNSSKMLDLMQENNEKTLKLVFNSFLSLNKFSYFFCKLL